MAQLADLDERGAQDLLGSANGAHLWHLANGIDDRAVVPDQRAKSIGHEETFARDHHRLETLHHELVRLGDSVATRLRARGHGGAHRLDQGALQRLPHDHPLGHAPHRRRHRPRRDPGGRRPARRSRPDPRGAAARHPREPARRAAARQLSLDDVEAPSWDDATDAVDAIRARYGADAIVPATLAGPEGIRVKRRGDQQWGPTGPVTVPDRGMA